MDAGRRGRSRRAIAGLTLLGAFAALTAIAYAAAGSLTWVEQDKNGVGGVTGLDGAIDVAVSPNGANVYAVGTNGAGSLATFTRNPGTGGLTFLESFIDGVGGVDGIAGARGVTVSADGKNVYVTGHGESALATFTRNPGTGALTWLEMDKDAVNSVDGIAGAWGLAVSPDDKHVYVAGDLDDAVATFSRNPTTGALTFVEFDKDGVSGVDGLDIATGVAVSPGAGGNVYVTSCGDSAIATFSRNATSGALTFIEQDKQGVGGVDGMACARGVAMDQTGASVYVAAESDDAVTTFARNNTTGALTFVDTDIDGAGGVDGLNGSRDVATSPDCSSVYTASAVDDAVSTFSRNPTTGELTFVEQDKDGVGGVDGVDQSVGVTVSPNSANVYSAAEFDDAVATFTREPSPTPVAGCGSEPPPPGDDPAARTVALSAKKKVKAGKKVKLSGDLSAPDDVTGCEASQTVEVQRKPKKKKAFKPLTSLTTDASGAFSLKTKVKKTTQYKAVVAASADCDGAESPVKKVKAKKKKK